MRYQRPRSASQGVLVSDGCLPRCRKKPSKGEIKGFKRVVIRAAADSFSHALSHDLDGQTEGQTDRPSAALTAVCWSHVRLQRSSSVRLDRWPLFFAVADKRAVGCWWILMTSIHQKPGEKRCRKNVSKCFRLLDPPLARWGIFLFIIRAEKRELVFIPPKVNDNKRRASLDCGLSTTSIPCGLRIWKSSKGSKTKSFP